MLISCGNDKTSSARTAAASLVDDYMQTQVELRLAQNEKPYLDINFAENELWLKLKGAVVWSCPITPVESDAEGLREFVKKFRGNDQRLVRPVVEKHLFSSREKTPDSVLKIVGEVVKVDPELLQRDLPARFQLLWENGLILEIRTDVQGKAKASLKNTMVQLSQKLQKPFGELTLIVSMTPEQAMTLYRVTNPGFPTMIHPPK
ncbi:MAG: hypothetical protein HY851_11495 [candidate division Zixibacteria bacterium]|nr:hypothetical protein [candidate division Zixibacteria bacterium]